LQGRLTVGSVRRILLARSYSSHHFVTQPFYDISQIYQRSYLSLI